MALKFLSIVRNVLLGELKTNADFDVLAPVDFLISAHHRISRLAAQVRLHADAAPYPQFACELRRIASEKQADAEELKKRIETFGARPWPSMPVPGSGQNHWERMNRDLKDQKSLDDFLQQQEIGVAGQETGIARLIEQLKARQAEHRKTLTKLVALADPQATQT